MLFVRLDTSGVKAPSRTPGVNDVTVMVTGQEDGELSRQQLRVMRGHPEPPLIGAVVKAGWRLAECRDASGLLGLLKATV